MITLKDLTLAEWEFEATKIMFKLKDELRVFTADDFYRLARAQAMPPALLKKFSGSMFRQFAAAGYIKKTDKFRLSERNGSSPLPVWEIATEKDAAITEKETE